MAKMTAPKILVVLDNDNEYTVQTDNRDMVRFDLMRGRKQWPTMQEAPMLWLTFLAWSALSREKELPGADVDKELDRILSVDVVDDEGNVVDLDDPDVADAVSVDPTQTAS